MILNIWLDLFLAVAVLADFLIFAYFVFGLLADLSGAPFVPTNQKMIGEILEKVKLKKRQKVLELGSGDGRFIREAAKKFKVEGVGVEINIILVYYSKLLTKLNNICGAKFKRGNFFQTELKGFEVIFFFLLPKTLDKLKIKILEECPRGTLIVSHGFKIPQFEKFLTKTIERKIFPTYIYRL